MADYDDENILECPVCLEPYDRMYHLPKMMSCLHTTCIGCIVAMLRVSKPPSNYEPSAPVYEAPRNRLVQMVQAINGAAGGNRSSSNAPPPIPQRHTTPNLHRAPSHAKPAVVKKHYEIPANTTFRCPLCRTSVNSNSVQTNRYIIAHLSDLKRLGGPKASTGGGITSGAPGNQGTTSQQQQQPQQRPQVPLLENWCDFCHYPAMDGCQDHDKTPLEEWTAQKVQTLQERTSLLQVRLRQHEDSLSASEKEVQDVLSALNAVISKLEIQRRDGRRLLGTLKALQDDWTRAGGEAATSEDRVDKLRKKAISLKEQTKLSHDLKNQTSRLERGGHDNVVMWQSEKKLYVKKDNLTFSITKECENYIS